MPDVIDRFAARMVTGSAASDPGVLTGALKVKGDRATALALNAMMVPPQPRKG